MTEPRPPLRREPAFRALWTARAVSVAGDSAGLVALLLYLSAGAGQALAVAALLLWRATVSARGSGRWRRCTRP